MYRRLRILNDWIKACGGWGQLIWALNPSVCLSAHRKGLQGFWSIAKITFIA